MVSAFIAFMSQKLQVHRKQLATEHSHRKSQCKYMNSCCERLNSEVSLIHLRVVTGILYDAKTWTRLGA